MKGYYKWQTTAAETLKDAVFFCIDAACGCGKTLAAILISIKKQMPTIVIAPTHSLCDQWKKDIEEELGEDADVFVYSRPVETKEGEKYRERFEAWLQA